MGAWGVGVFENDDASDWVYELEQSSDLIVVQQALSDVTATGEDGPETMESAAALAAAEVVAALRGRPGDGLPDDVGKWVASLGEPVTADLVALARSAVRQVLTASELKDVWDQGDTEQGEEWEAQLEDLLTRLD